MSKIRIVTWSILVGAAVAAFLQPLDLFAQGQNPYRPVEGLQAGGGPGRLGGPWAKLPGGLGSPGGMDVDVDGEHIWVVMRCGGAGDPGVAPLGSQTSCAESNADPLIRFNQDGTVDRKFGSGMLVWPHGFEVDPDGNIWVAEAAEGQQLVDAAAFRGRPMGHQVFKLSPTGELLMTLGEAGVPGNDESHFRAPVDVVVAPNGDIFVADGHATEGNNRIVKFSSDGTYIMSFGETGYGPGQHRGLHAITLDPISGNLFVADRRNQRIVIWDQEGNYISRWTSMGMPSDIAITPDGTIYVADSESDLGENAGYEKGIRIGDVRTGFVNHFILDLSDNPPFLGHGGGPENLTVDRFGNVYGGEPRTQTIRKWIKIR